MTETTTIQDEFNRVNQQLDDEKKRTKKLLKREAALMVELESIYRQLLHASEAESNGPMVRRIAVQLKDALDASTERSSD